MSIDDLPLPASTCLYLPHEIIFNNDLKKYPCLTQSLTLSISLTHLALALNQVLSNLQKNNNNRVSSIISQRLTSLPIRPAPSATVHPRRSPFANLFQSLKGGIRYPAFRIDVRPVKTRDGAEFTRCRCGLVSRRYRRIRVFPRHRIVAIGFFDQYRGDRSSL